MSEASSKHLLFRLLGVLTFIVLTLICGEIFVRLFFSYYTPDTVKKHSLPYVPAVYARHDVCACERPDRNASCKRIECQNLFHQ